MTLRLERDVGGSGPEHRWARWRVVDDAGRLVGFVTEDREWLGHGYAASSYDAAHNPTGAAFKADWRGEGFTTPREALDALAQHTEECA